MCVRCRPLLPLLPRALLSRSLCDLPSASASRRFSRSPLQSMRCRSSTMRLDAGGCRRHLTAFLCLCVATICYADRTNIGIALPAFVQSPEEQGLVLSAFFYGYLLTQVLGGVVAAKVGAKWVLIAGVLLWTFFDVSTLAVAGSLRLLCLSRAFMGLGEGILFPSLHQIAGAWYPLQERSYLVALVASGIDLGTILSLLVAPLILNAWGWSWIFGVFGALSLLWVLAFTIWGSSRPEDDPHISGQELDFITRNRTADHLGHVAVEADGDKSVVNWRVLLGSRAAWAIYVAHICTNYSWYVLLGWSPQYCQQVLKISLSGGVAAIPYVAGYAGTMLFGRLGDWFVVTYGARELHVRQGMSALSLLGSAFFLYSLRFAQSAGIAVTLMALALFTSRASNAGFWVNMVDIGAPTHAAHVMGVSNTLATIPGIVGNMITGKILAATGDWSMVFGVAAAVAVVGAVVFHFNASDESIFTRPDDQQALETGKRGGYYSNNASNISSATSLSGTSPEAGHLLPKISARQTDEDAEGEPVMVKYS